MVYVSATPGPYELAKTGGEVVEQVIRPTGLLDPEIEVAPARSQVPHLLGADPPARGRRRAGAGDHAHQAAGRGPGRLFQQAGRPLQVAAQRTGRLRAGRTAPRPALGEFDVLVGVNLLREGLDLPEVSLVAILDADKEGFLRSETSLMQTIGRSGRNVNAKVVLYADKVTDSMQRAARSKRVRLASPASAGQAPSTASSCPGSSPPIWRREFRVTSDRVRNKRTGRWAGFDLRQRALY